MVEYKIKIYYSTGDSNSSNDETSYLDLTWVNLDIAKENLRRIKEHYLQYQELRSWNHKDRLQIFNENKHKNWFVNIPKLFCISSNCAIDEKDKKKVGDGNWEYRPDQHFAEYCLKLKTDKGSTMQISAFWCGHFESLHSAEIELNNDDMKIEFD